MQKRTKRNPLPLLLAALAFLAGGFGARGADGPSLVAEARADAAVQIDVAVAQGSRGASGMDEAVQKHKAILDRIGGYGGWKPSGGANLTVGVGKTGSKKLGEHTFSVTADSVGGDKARTTIVVVDGAGKQHKVSSSLARGGSTVVVVQSADGAGVHAYIVTINY